MAYLRVFMGDTLLQQCELNSERTTIGRTRDNDIVLNSDGVSKHHATIVREGDTFVPVSYTHLTLPTRSCQCRSRWSPDH